MLSLLPMTPGSAGQRRVLGLLCCSSPRPAAVSRKDGIDSIPPQKEIIMKSDARQRADGTGKPAKDQAEPKEQARPSGSTSFLWTGGQDHVHGVTQPENRKGPGGQTGDALWSNPANWLGPDKEAPAPGDEVEFDRPPLVVEPLDKGTHS
jgi:hypothetical protein